MATSEAAISKAVTTVILISITVTVAISIALWVGNLTFGVLPGTRDVKVISNPRTVKKAIDKAEESILKAEESIRTAEEQSAETSSANRLLDESRQKRLDAWSAYADGEYPLAEELAEKSETLASQAEAAAREALMLLQAQKSEADQAIARAIIARDGAKDAIDDAGSLSGSG